MRVSIVLLAVVQSAALAIAAVPRFIRSEPVAGTCEVEPIQTNWPLNPCNCANGGLHPLIDYVEPGYFAMEDLRISRNEKAARVGIRMGRVTRNTKTNEFWANNDLRWVVRKVLDPTQGDGCGDPMKGNKVSDHTDNYENVLGNHIQTGTVANPGETSSEELLTSCGYFHSRNEFTKFGFTRFIFKSNNYPSLDLENNCYCFKAEPKFGYGTAWRSYSTQRFGSCNRD